MTFEQFHNGLRILLNLDLDQLVAFGVIPSGDFAAWQAFTVDPFRWLVCADDDHGRRLWALMQTRMR